MVKYLADDKIGVKDSMVQVLGIGGFFFRSKDPSGLTEWYQTHLGINPAPTDETMEPWMTDRGVTVFSPFEEGTDYFAEGHTFMLNFRVKNLSVALEELNAAGIESGDVVSMDGVGKFARIHDPEGNPIELWEAAD
jgi:predicted enzyme related to lactoylglutathione lyase